MYKKGDFIYTIISSLRYAFSNMGSLLIGGIAITLSLLLIGLPFILGYITRCMREIIRGNGVLPDWDEVMSMFIDGLRMSVIFFVYAAIYVAIVIIPLMTVIIFQYLELGFLALASTTVLLFIMTSLACILGIVFFASWVLYAITGSVRSSVNYRFIMELILINPKGYLIAVLASAIVVVAGAVPMALFITIPWVAFAIIAAVTFNYSMFYQSTMNIRADYIKSGGPR